MPLPVPDERHVASWTVAETAQWLECIGMGERVAATFAARGVGGAELLRLSAPALREMGITKMAVVRRLLAAVDGLRSAATAAATPAATVRK